MKTFIYLISLLTVFATQAQQFSDSYPTAQSRYLVLKNTKNKSNTTKTLSIFNHKAEILTEIDVRTSGKYDGMMLNLNDPNRFYYYEYIDRKNAVLKIYSKSDFSMIGSIDMAPLNTYISGVNAHEYFGLNKDKSKLSLFTGTKKNQALLIVDLNTGRIIHNIKTGKNKTLVNSFNDGDVVVSVDMSGSQKFFNVYDINLGKPIFSKSFNNKPLHAHVFDELVFYGYKIPHQNDRNNNFKNRNKNLTKPAYKYFIKNLTSDAVLDFTFTSRYPAQFIQNKNGILYFVGTDIDKRNSLVVYEFKNGNFNKLETGGVSVQPKTLLLTENEERLVAIGKKNMTSLTLKQTTNPIETSLPFDTASVILNKAGTLAYLKEGSGSEVALINLETGALIERSGTGRKGVKIGQFLASSAMLAVGANLGYIAFSAKFSDTASTLSQDEKQLFTINSKTNDVTLFNAKDLSGRTALATGGGTFLVFQ